MSDAPPPVHATRPLSPGSDPRGPGPASLLVLEGASSSRHSLPGSGILLIGRDPEADVRLGDDSVSRRHARLVLQGGEARIIDLGSHNGTRVNGQRVEGAHALVSGDVVTLGTVTLVLRTATRVAPPARVLEAEALFERLGMEVRRALRFGRPLTVLALVPPTPGAGREDVEATCAAVLGSAGAAGWLDAGHLVGVLPEVSGEPGEDGPGECLEALAAACPGARLGWAVCPTDGCDADTLVAAAREAAQSAPPGQCASAASSATRLTLAERTVLVADPAMVQLYALVRRLAPSELPVLVSGETGVGKENAAFAVHHWSRRAAGPFLTLNCAALPEGLVESELFGHDKGAFTGASSAKAGIFESAQGGTVFLDEVGELPLAVQARFLRALESRRITRVGEVRERPIDVRLVAATHRDLEAEVAAGRFRQDLYFRLGAATVLLPPLRERPREVPLLARAFLDRACEALGRAPLVLAPETLATLAHHAWPGNVRELRNLMDYAAAAVEGGVLEAHHLPERVRGVAPAPVPAPAPPEPARPPPPPPGRAAFQPLAEELRELEHRRMREALEAAEGVQTRAAALIGMPIRTFSFKMRQFGLQARAPRRGTPPP
ncbi:sigma 54-interacting transcriptional regulator [Archangium primigenium]|uniref:sigma 54-interacting transcriptional regulator n=1 Tax=[Archangium] primigenium TaxID=2792470 RepID=UPI0019585A96|nr:sigma 54-interacting transcriptional regulator [Archangium primigenium]MBM7112018.1 sigma 54-interacting transcriptional regulator [Archangium primigenium]